MDRRDADGDTNCQFSRRYRRARQGRLARSLAPFPATARRGRADTPRVAVPAARKPRRSRRARGLVRPRRRSSSRRLHQGLHGRHDELADIVRRAAQIGFPVAVHAIGDLANREALDAFEATQEEWRPRGLRQRIEHAQLLAEEDLPRFGRLGIAASVQFSHAPSDRDIADRYWAGMTHRAYAFRSLADNGALIANGSDAPIEELDPLLGIRAGVLRTLDEREGWHPEQAVTVQQALEATTINPAWLARDERRRGKLVPGYLADLVVLDRDLLTCPPEELPDVQVVATMLGGRWVHNPPPWD